MRILKNTNFCRYSFSIFLSILFCNFGINISQDLKDEIKTICSNPQRDLDFDPKWVHDNAPPTGWHALFGNKVTRLHFAQLLQGKKLNDDADFSKLCLKTVFDNNDEKIGGIYQGYGNLTATRHCFHENGDKITCEAISSTNPSYSEKFRGHVTHVDKKNFRSFHIAVFCYGNGDIGWVVASIPRKLTDEDTATIKEQLKLIGFNPEDQIKLYEDSCGD